MTKKLRKMERENDTLKGKCDSMGKDIHDLREEVRVGACTTARQGRRRGP